MANRDLTNQRFGRWFVIKRAGSSKTRRQSMWECRCDCGIIKRVVSSSLTGGKSKSCGCLQREVTSNRHRLPDGEASFNALYRNYKTNARSTGRLFNLTKLQFRKLIQQNCFYCNLPPHKIFKNRKSTVGFVYNGIDRVDNSKGYVIDNCVSCCWKCNHMKYTYETSEFLDKVKLIYENLNL